MTRPLLLALCSLAAASTALAQPVDPDDELTDAELEALIEAAGETIEIAGPTPLDPAPPGGADATGTELATAAGSAGDAMGAIKNLPGVAQAQSFDGTGHLAIRGTSGEDSLFLVDDIPVPLAMHFDNAQTVLPAELIDSVELVPGGFGVEHGRATGGVVSLHTRPASAERVTGFAEVSFINAGAMIEGPLLRGSRGVPGKLSGSLSLRRSIIDALLPVLVPDDAPVSFATPPRYYDGQARLDWRPDDRHHLSLRLLGSDDVVGFAIDAENPYDPVVSGDFSGTDRFWRSMLRHRLELGSLSNTATLAIGKSRRERFVGDPAAPQFYYSLRPWNVYLREQLRWRPLARLQIRSGADLESITGRVDGRTALPPTEGGRDPIFADDAVVDFDQPMTDLCAAAWLAADVEVVDDLVVSPGLRVDRMDRQRATDLQPRLAVRYTIARPLSLRLAGGLYSRPLTLAEALPDDLEPERAAHLVAGADLRIAEGATASVSGFRTWLRDLVVGDVGAADPLGAYDNAGEGEVIGLEAMVRIRRDNLFGWLAYTASRSTRRDGPGMPTRPFDYDQTHNLTAVASYRLGSWRFGGRVRVASGLPHTPVVGSVYQADRDLYLPVYGAVNSERLTLHHQVDVRVDRRFELGPVRLDGFLDVANVYANAQQLDQSYNFDYSDREPITDVPLLPSIGLRGTF